MTWNELKGLIDSPTLERDVKHFEKTNDMAADYTPDEQNLIREFIKEATK